ncbi:carboxymuconolactone decarboxylase family protein [candidate division WOR-3 bacterium]|nr:carboxymuconolactone decarboxylase family protein [candidate division WOR-3 bacterium]
MGKYDGIRALLKRPKNYATKCRVKTKRFEDLGDDYKSKSAYELSHLAWATAEGLEIRNGEPVINWDQRIPNLTKAFGLNPEILQTEIPFANSFIFNKTRIPRGWKELVIVTTGRINKCAYTVYAHEWYAVTFGWRDWLETEKVSQKMLDDLENWETSNLFKQEEKAVIELAINICLNSHKIPDSVFEQLKSIEIPKKGGGKEKVFQDKEVVEIVLLSCHFNLLCRFLNTLRVEIEPDRIEQNPKLIPIDSFNESAG